MGVIELIVLVVLVVFLVQKADAIRSRITVRSSGWFRESKRSIQAITSVAWCWLAPTSVMAVFISLNSGSILNWERFFDSPVVIGDPQIVVRETPTLPSALTTRFIRSPKHLPQGLPAMPELPAEKVELTPRSDLAGNRPQWTVEKEQTTGDIRRVVLTSQLWSTEEEAKEELRGRVAALVRSDFEARHHGWLDPDSDRFLNDDRAVEVAVKEKYIERFEQDFGKFKSPMNKVWWQVELSPMVRTELYPAWKTAVVENRIIIIGSILAMVTLLANECALFVRLRREANGKTARAALVTAGSFTAWVATEIFLASQLLS